MSSPTPTNKKLYLVDAHGFIHRAHHALEASQLRNSKGEPVWALYGFARMLLGLLKKEKPDAVAICFDAPGPTFRHKDFAGYKANRPDADVSLKDQFPKARRLAEALGLKCVEAPGFEADDILATLAKRGEKEGFEVVLVTSDKDAMQLVDPKVRVLLDVAKGAFMDEGGVEQKYGLRPSQMVDYFTLTGDAIDEVPGARGIGPKTAVKLLKEHNSLDKIMELVDRRPEAFPNGVLKSLLEFKPRAEQTRSLIRLAEDVPLPLAPADCAVEAPGPKAVDILRELEFSSLIAEVFPQGLALESKIERLKPAELAARLKKAKRLSVAAVEGAEVPTLAVGLPDGAVCVAEPAALKDVLSSEVPKVGHDLKAVVKAAPLNGPLFDTMLAAYCLNPSKPGYRFEEVMLDQLAQPLMRATGPEAAARAASTIWPLAEKLRESLTDPRLAELLRDVELPLMKVLAEMELAGVAVDVEYLSKLSHEFETAIHGLKAEIDKAAGCALNPNSPKQVAKVLFEDLKLPALRKTKTGYSTDEETLRSLAQHHALPEKLVEYREWTKLKGTYIDGLLAAARNGRVHTTFNQTGAATGRLSSVDPNLQNIPIRSTLGMKIRRAFTAPKGSVLVSADYSQIDLRLLAHESGDPALTDSFKSGEDVHRRTACEVFHKRPADVTKEDRRIAKAVNFGVAYGQTPHGLSTTLGIPMAEAQAIIARYFDRYAGVKSWIDRHLVQARKDGFVRTWLGRVRYLPELSAKNPNLRAFAERAAVNTTIQGGSADVMKKAMLDVAAALPKEWPGVRMILQVHDDLLFEVPAKKAPEFSRWVKEAMEGAAELRVPLQADVKTGPNWADMDGVHR